MTPEQQKALRKLSDLDRQLERSGYMLEHPFASEAEVDEWVATSHLRRTHAWGTSIVRVPPPQPQPPQPEQHHDIDAIEWI